MKTKEEEHVAVFDLVVSVYWRGKKTLLQATLKSRACNRRHFNFSLSLVSLPKKEKKITRLLSNIQRSNYYKQERDNFQFTGVKWVLAGLLTFLVRKRRKMDWESLSIFILRKGLTVDK